MLLPKTEDGAAKIDLSTLRTFRVLRPLKLVSGVPSEFVQTFIPASDTTFVVVRGSHSFGYWLKS